MTIADRPDMATMLQAFFRRLNASGIPYVVVGDVRGFPHEVSGDVDFVVPQHRLDQVHGIIRAFADKQGLALVQVLQHEASAFYTCLGWIGPDGYCVLKLDYCGDYIRRARLLLRAETLLAGARAVAFGPERLDHFRVPANGPGFVYYLCKRLDKGELSERNAAYLAALWQQAPDRVRTSLKAIWSEAGLSRIERLIAPGNMAREDDIAVLRQALYRRRPRRWPDVAQDLVRRVGRFFRPTGLVVALMGPDGSGKSLLIEALLAQQQDGFRRTRYFHLRPGVLGTSEDAKAPTTDPHAKPAYGTAKSAVKLAYVAADYLLGYWLKVRPAVVRSSFVIFDRYYHDLLVDPRRSRYGAPDWLVRLLGYFVPKPDLMLVLDAEVDVILARKQEVTRAECARQVAAYRALAEDHDFVRLIDANQSPAVVAASANMAIAEFMAERVRRRHG
jgi:thymidylate kinase